MVNAACVEGLNRSDSVQHIGQSMSSIPLEAQLDQTNGSLCSPIGLQVVLRGQGVIYAAVIREELLEEWGCELPCPA